MKGFSENFTSTTSEWTSALASSCSGCKDRRNPPSPYLDPPALPATAPLAMDSARTALLGPLLFFGRNTNDFGPESALNTDPRATLSCRALSSAPAASLDRGRDEFVPFLLRRISRAAALNTAKTWEGIWWPRWKMWRHIDTIGGRVGGGGGSAHEKELP